jgi:hypothetical protein
MIIDSPIISGSFAASGSLNQFGNVTITGSLTVSGPIIGSITGSADSASFATTASYWSGSIVNAQSSSFAANAQNAVTASYLSNYIPPFPYTGSAGISGSLTVNGPITAQTLIVQTITSSEDFVTGSTHFGTIIDNTHQFTGSVSISGSLAVNGSSAVLTNQTSSMSVATASYWSGSINNVNSASFASTASYWSGSITNVLSASYALTASYASNVPLTASFADNATSASYALTASYWSGSIENVATASFVTLAQSASYWSGSITNAATASFVTTAQTASFVQNAQSASYWSGSITNATSASYALTASYISGSGGGVGFPFSGSAVITGSLLITELSGSGTKYVITDNNGLLSISSGSTAIKVTETITSTTNQTSFTVPNGYTTGLVDVFINGVKLNDAEFTDNDGVTITLATGSNSGDIVEFAKYQPANGVTNNALRQQTTFIADAGQTVFSASYTPGLLDIFYNGSRLSNSDYTANNGTYFTLATASAVNDILDVFVYSYQVGAFNGIGGTGVTSQIAYFNTTSSITGSNNFTINGSTMTVTGSLLVSGSGTFTNIGPAVLSGSVNISGSLAVGGANVVLSTQTSSLNVATASLAVTASSADNFLVRNTLTAQTLVVQTITSSVDFVTGSTRFGSIIDNTHVFTGSMSVSGSTDIKDQLRIGGSTVISYDTNAETTRLGVGYAPVSFAKAIIIDNSTDHGLMVRQNNGAGKIVEFSGPEGALGLMVSGSGRVGIGTANPSAPLEISYNNTSFTTTPILSLNNTNINGQTHINFLITGSLVGKIRSDYEGGMIYVTNNRGLDRSHYFLVNGDVGTGSVAMAISSSGRIGMGTSSPSARLDIQGGSDGDGMISMGSNSVSGILNSPANIYINADSDNNASGIIALGFNRIGYTGGSEAVRILEDGSVGIGITNPSRRLQVKSNSEGQTAGISGATYGIRFDNGGTNSPNMSTIHGVDASLVGSYQPIMLNGSDVRFGTSDTERMRITSGGYLRLAGAGIQFNGDTADANSLDDYEEGIWTPTLSGAGGDATYLSGYRNGWYTKIGRVVNIAWFISFSKNTLSGTLRLTNLPFALLNGPGVYYPQGTVLLDGLSTATNNITLQGANNTSGADFIGGNGSTSTHVGLPISVLGAGAMECRGTLTYFTA